MVQVAPGFPWGPTAEPAQRARDVDEVDQRRPRAQLHEPERFDPALLAAAEHPAVELDRALDVAHAQHDVIDAADLDRPHCDAQGSPQGGRLVGRRAASCEAERRWTG